ncbi:MAG: glycerophosphodiester phosphodiesterase family protein, partial [Flavobacteriaceae bacterium]
MKINVIIMLFLTATAVSQTEKATISVRGNCGMCKARIEKAAIKTKGVKYAVWQTDTEKLTVFYNTKKTSVKQVATNIAAVGHEANGIVASDEAYDALPMCCQYVKGKPLVIGHRGAMGHAPENTLPSIRAALKLGVDAIEIDVFRIASGELVVFHDKTLGKLTNGSGAIETKTLDELSKLSVLGSAKIPTLKEVLTEISGAASVNVELKGANTAEGTISLFDDFVSRGIFTTEQLYVSSFNWDELRDFRKVTNKYDIAILTDKNPLDS